MRRKKKKTISKNKKNKRYSQVYRNKCLEKQKIEVVEVKADTTIEHTCNCKECNKDKTKVTVKKSKINKILSVVTAILAILCFALLILNVRLFKNPSIEQTELFQVSEQIDALAIGLKVEESTLFSTENKSSIDYYYDYRFTDVSSYITDAYIKVPTSGNTIDEIMILETTESDKVYNALTKYKKEMINQFKENGDKENLRIVENSIIKEKNNFVYYIATSENSKKIDKIIRKTIS